MKTQTQELETAKQIKKRERFSRVRRVAAFFHSFKMRLEHIKARRKLPQPKKDPSQSRHCHFQRGRNEEMTDI